MSSCTPRRRTSGGYDAHQRNTIDATRNLLHAMHADGVSRLVLVSSLSVIRPPRTPWERQDEQTPRPSNPRPLGAYTWGKSLQEELVEREAAALGIATRIIRPGALVDCANPELPGLMGRRLVGRWHLGLGRPDLPIAVCDVEQCAEAIAWCATHFDEAPPVVESLRSRGDDTPPADRSSAIEGLERPVCVGPDQRHLCRHHRGSGRIGAYRRTASRTLRVVVDPSSATIRQPSRRRHARCDAPRLCGTAIYDAAARADAAAPRGEHSISLRGNAVRVFVTDGDQRPALAVTRSLGLRGISVLVGEDTPASLASCSKYCSRHVTYPSPREHARAFDEFLLDFVEREQIDMVLPVTDVTMHAVSRLQETLRSRTALAVPSFDAFERVTEKSRLVARGFGLRRCSAPHGIRQHASRMCTRSPARLPIPSSSSPVVRGFAPAPDGCPRRCSTPVPPTELLRLYRKTDYLISAPSLVQQRIVGPGEGLFTLFDRGRLLTAFAHRRLREKPPSGGVSVLSESIAVDPDLRDAAIRLLGPLGWHGVAMLEYKRDARSGQRFLMEVNGRFWGSLQLAVDAGVDFPYLTYQLAWDRRLLSPAPIASASRVAGFSETSIICCCGCARATRRCIFRQRHRRDLEWCSIF